MNDYSARRLTVEEVPTVAPPPQPPPNPVPVPAAPVEAPLPPLPQAPVPPAPQPVAEQQPQQPVAPVVNGPHKDSHPLRKLLFLVPALLVLGTIVIVANVANNNYSVLEPEPIVTPEPLAQETAAPVQTPTPALTSVYTNENFLLRMSIPETYEVLDESADYVSLGMGELELITIDDGGIDISAYPGSEVSQVTISGEEVTRVALQDEWYLVKGELVLTFLLDTAARAQEFERIIESIVFLLDTSDWEEFNNNTFGYKLNYPPDWHLLAQSGREGYLPKTEIRKNANDASLHNLVIETTDNLANASLTASEIISSTRTLSGWANPPKTRLKAMGGGDAQVIEGELGGRWRVYVVVWYRNKVIQMTWSDDTSQGEQKYLDNILASFEFTN